MQKPLSLDFIRQVVAEYFTDKPVRKVEIFGSYARGEATAESDVDLLLSQHDDALSLFDLVNYREDLEQLLGLSVDLGTQIDPYILRYVQPDLTLAYEQAAARRFSGAPHGGRLRAGRDFSGWQTGG